MTKQASTKFWSFRNSIGTEPPQLIIYGSISESSWWGDEITPKQFSDELLALGDVDEIVVRINSGGGDVFAANAIYTRLKDHKAKITVKIDGWAASSATIVAMAGDVIEIPGNGVFMLHNPEMAAHGYYDEYEFAAMCEELKVIKSSIVNGYALKTGKSTEDIAEIMRVETWYNGTDAVAAGFCDKLMFAPANTKVENATKVVVNSIAYDLTKYPKMPISLINQVPGHLGHEEEEYKMSEINTKDQLVSAYPNLINQICEEAIIGERNRIKAIDDMSMPGFEAIIAAAKYTKPITAPEMATQILMEQKKQGARYLTGREEDVKSSGMAEVKDEAHEGRKEKKEDPYLEAVNRVMPKTN